MQSHPGKIVIAPDSFKESLRADRVIDAIKTGLNKEWDEAFQTTRCPMADGGEGSLGVILTTPGAEERMCTVRDPLSREADAKYALLDSGKTAFIEMAQASGLERLTPEERNPTLTWTYGTGQLIEDALLENPERVIIGIGGSATNDAGTGLAAALGYRFLNKHGKPINPCGGNLSRIHTIDYSDKHAALISTEFLVACDVTNPLCGPNGATMTYAAQKGATPEQIERLEAGMQYFSKVLDDYAGESVSTLPGAGAAGGLGAGLVAFCGAKMVPGFDLIANIHNLDNAIETADLVITGEGRMDHQTLHGKVPAGVAKIAKRYNKPCVAFCGSVSDHEALQDLGFTNIYSIMDIAKDKDDAMQNAAHYLTQLAATFARDWNRVIDSQP